MANYIYGAVSLTGGGTGSLDNLDGKDLFQNDAAIVFTPNATYIYTLDEINNGSQNVPELIKPSTNAGTKRWILVSSRAAESSCDYTLFNGILSSSDDDVQKALSTIDDMFNVGDFVIAPGSVALSPTVVKSVGTNLGNVTPSDHIFNILGSGKIKTVGVGSNVTVSVDDLKIATKTSAYTILPTDDIIVADCAGSNVELTLPQASLKSAVTVIKKSNSNTLTINCYGSQTIEGRSSITILDEYGTLRLISDGTNTWITSAQMYDLPSATQYDFGAIKVGANLTSTNGVLTTDLSAVNSDIIPDLSLTRSLGSPLKAWKDIFVGPGSLYVNGQKVLQDSGGTIVVGADTDQNIQIKTGGGGDIEFYPSGSGAIEMKGNLSIQAGKNLISNDGNPISCTVGFKMNGEAITGLGLPEGPTDAVNKTFATNASNLLTGSLLPTLIPNNFLKIANNFSDLLDVSAARLNLGIGNVKNIDTTNASNITTGILPSSVLPPIAISTIKVVSSEIEMLALTTVEGNVVVRTDLNITYINNGGTSGTMDDFTELSTPGDAVSSVNGQTGTVLLTQDNINNGSTYVRTHNDFSNTLLIKLNGIEEGATSDQTSLEIKTSYESNLDTNPFTDSYKSKIDSIEEGATGDLTAAEILTLIKTVDGANSGLDSDSVDGFSPITTATSNTIALRDTNGDLKVRNLISNVVSTSETQTDRTSDAIFYSSVDNFIHKNTALGFKKSLGLENAPNVIAASGNTGNSLVKRDVDGNFSAKEITSDLIGNSTTSSSLKTPRSISLSGDVSGTVNFDGSANVSIPVTIVDNSHDHLWENISNKPITFEPNVSSVKDLVGSMLTGNITNGINVTYQSESSTIDFILTASPVITLNGDVTGHATMTNLGNVYLTTTITNDSHNHTLSTLPSINEEDMISDSEVLLPTQHSVKTYVDIKVADVINSAPAALDTLNELSAALGDDPNFATTITTSLGNKASKLLYLTAGDGLTGGGDLQANRTISHGDTSTQPSVTNESRTYIKDIILDDYGHITAISSGTETVVNTNTWRDINDTPIDGSITVSISSNWAYNHANLKLAHGATNLNTPSTIVARDSNGDFTGRYIDGTYFKTTHDQSSRTSDTVFYTGTDDGYINKNTDIGIKTSLNLENVTNIEAVSTNTANTIVLRDANGDFSASVITATVTKARFADLAEKHTCDNINLTTGTLVSACTEGIYEVQECTDIASHTVIGVISEKAAYIMNNDLENSVIVGLVGKVPVRVIGPVEKGKAIMSAGKGRAKQITNNMEILFKIGIALETNNSEEEKLVYCAIK